VSTPAGASRRGFWIGFALGAPIVAWGLRGAAVNSADVNPVELVAWVGGSAIVHDALLLPMVVGAAVAARRVTPPWAWPAVRWALATSALLLIVSGPFVAGYGRSASNPTVLTRNYGTGVLVALVVVGLVTTLWAAWGRRRSADSVRSRGRH
jgi:hypothetical protein